MREVECWQNCREAGEQGTQSLVPPPVLPAAHTALALLSWFPYLENGDDLIYVTESL